MSIEPQVSVVIVSFNTRELLRECINTLDRESSGVTYETIVVDNASRDGSADMVAADFPNVRLVRSDKNLGFAAANNLGFAEAGGKYVVLLNSDAFLKHDALRISVERMNKSPQVGLAGAQLISRDGSWQPSARKFPSLLNDFLTLSGLAARYPHSRLFGRFDRTWADPKEPAEIDWVPGAYSIVRRDLLMKLGGFDERFFLYYEEVDLCRRIKQAGYQVWYWPDVIVIHLGGESSKTVTRLSMSSKGAQLTLWRMRAAFLYYRKHHGLAGAVCAMNLEAQWHRLRALRARSRGSSDDLAKAEESRVLVATAQQAWRETSGGMTCPPRPW